MARTTYNTGTTSSATTFISSGGTITIPPGSFKIYNGGRDQLQITKNLFGGSKKRVITMKGFWEGVEWEEFKTYRPRKSITGKIIIGKMHKRCKKIIIKGFTSRTGHVISTVLGRETSRTQYANTKELFEEKLRGKA